MDLIKAKAHLLQKLTQGRVWGGKHLPLDVLNRSIPEVLKNTHRGQRLWKQVLHDLTNDGFLIVHMKRTGKGSDVHVSLNPRKVDEIDHLIDEGNR